MISIWKTKNRMEENFFLSETSHSDMKYDLYKLTVKQFS